MTANIIDIGMIMVLFASIGLIVRYRHTRTAADTPLSLFSLVAVLFTSGLDGGLVMLPLIEFPLYQDATQFPEYQSISPLLLEFVFWGATVWLIYFVSTAYFCFVEPKLRLFEHLWVRIITSLIVLVTCAFTLSLYLQNLPFYLSAVVPSSQIPVVVLLAFFIVLAGTLIASLRVSFMTQLSRFSALLFVCAIGVFAIRGGLSLSLLMQTWDVFTTYIEAIPRFLLPTSDYHRFYIAWWFSWAILLGQFISKFTHGLTSWQLLMVMVIAPLIPTFAWFSVLYHAYTSLFHFDGLANWLLIILGTLFVVNSLDFMIASYSRALNISSKRLGRLRYFVLNFCLLSSFTWLFFDKYLFIEWVALVVILLMMITAAAMLIKHGMRQPIQT